MFKLSQKSLDKLAGVHDDLCFLVHKAMELQIMDFSVVEGVRTVERQRELVAAGKSKTMNSKHLVQDDGTGHAVDLYPYPIDMNRVNQGDAREIARFGVLAGIIRALAKQNDIMVVNGADWDGDGENLDHTFFDAPHFQLVIR